MKFLKIGLIVLVAVGIVIGGVRIIKHKKELNEKEKTATLYPINVKTIYIQKDDVTLTLPYLAEVKNDNSVIITSKFAGKIEYIANLGEKVKKGQKIVQIDDSALKAKLSEIESQIKATKESITALKIALNNLKANHKRTKKLLEVKMASIEAYNNESTKIAQTKAQLKSNQAKLLALNSTKDSIINDLKYTSITSSIDGVVSNLFLHKGDNSFAGKPILKISSNEGKYLFFTLPNDIKEIEFNNKLYEVTPLDSTFNGLRGYKVDIDTNLLEGEKTKIKVVTFRGVGTCIPYSAILSIDNSDYVLEVKDNKAYPKKLHIIASGSKGVVVSDEITRVVKANADILLKIKAGYPIRVRN